MRDQRAQQAQVGQHRGEHGEAALVAIFGGRRRVHVGTRIDQLQGLFDTARARCGMEFGFHGCFHEVRPDRIVQTFTWEGDPDGVALETLDFEDLGDGRTRLRTQSLCDSFENRDAWLRSGMETGLDQGYARLDAMLADENAGIAAGVEK